MKIDINLETLRAMMGTEATMDEARRMAELLRARGITDTDEVSDDEFFALVAETAGGAR